MSEPIKLIPVYGTSPLYTAYSALHEEVMRAVIKSFRLPAHLCPGKVETQADEPAIAEGRPA